MCDACMYVRSALRSVRNVGTPRFASSSSTRAASVLARARAQNETGKARLYKWIAVVRRSSLAHTARASSFFPCAPTHDSPTRQRCSAQIASVGAVLLFGVMFALNLAANEASKESHVLGHTLTAPDGEAVRVQRVESFATLYDLPRLDTNVLAELKDLRMTVDMSEDAKANAVVEMSIKVSSVWKPTGYYSHCAARPPPLRQFRGEPQDPRASRCCARPLQRRVAADVHCLFVWCLLLPHLRRRRQHEGLHRDSGIARARSGCGLEDGLPHDGRQRQGLPNPGPWG